MWRLLLRPQISNIRDMCSYPLHCTTEGFRYVFSSNLRFSYTRSTMFASISMASSIYILAFIFFYLFIVVAIFYLRVILSYIITIACIAGYVFDVNLD